MTDGGDVPVHEFSTEFDLRFIRNGIRRDVARRTVVVLAVFLLSVGCIAWVLGTPPTRSPVGGALIAGAIVGLALIPWKITRTAKRTEAYWVRLSPDRLIRYRLFPDAVEVELPNGTGRHQWAGMRRLWRYRDIWLLELVRGWSVLVPSDAPPEALDYIAERCRAAGVRT